MAQLSTMLSCLHSSWLTCLQANSFSYRMSWTWLIRQSDVGAPADHFGIKKSF